MSKDQSSSDKNSDFSSNTVTKRIVAREAVTLSAAEVSEISLRLENKNKAASKHNEKLRSSFSEFLTFISSRNSLAKPLVMPFKVKSSCR